MNFKWDLKQLIKQLKQQACARAILRQRSTTSQSRPRTNKDKI